jgi:hypothetical protein
MTTIINIPSSQLCQQCGLDWSKHPLSSLSCPETDCKIIGLHCHQILRDEEGIEIIGGIKVSQ